MKADNFVGSVSFDVCGLDDPAIDANKTNSARKSMFLEGAFGDLKIFRDAQRFKRFYSSVSIINVLQVRNIFSSKYYAQSLRQTKMPRHINVQPIKYILIDKNAGKFYKTGQDGIMI